VDVLQVTNLSLISIANVVLGDAGNYYCIVTDGHGSTVQSAFVMLSVNALPLLQLLQLVGPTTFCTGGSVTLTSSAGHLTYGRQCLTASINITTAGSYTVRVTNASGCQSVASVAT